MLNNILSRNKALIIAFLIITVMVIAAVAPSFSSRTFAQDEKTEEAAKRTLNVSGYGKVIVVPDIAYLTLGVITEHENAATAQKDNAAAMDKVISTIKSAGIKDEDIRTTNYSIYPKYNYIKETGEQRIIGYTANNSIQVTVRDTSKVGEIIDLASKSGVNITSGISFGLSNYDEYYCEALKNAVENAKKKAETMASAFGIVLGVPASMTESGGYAPSPVYRYKADYAVAEEASFSTPIQSGTIEVSANVSLSYEY